LIVSGKRRFEIRSWRTDYKGCLLIHAAKKIDEEACRRLAIPCGEFALGAIVGKVRIEEIIEFTPGTWQALQPEHMEWSDFRPGTFGWRLSEAVKFESPIPWSGSLGLFDVPDNVIPGTVTQEESPQQKDLGI
jgi:activating signal cointegrator 1